MTKREIFKRLQNIRDYARVTDTWPHDNAAQQNLHLRNAVEAIAKDLGELLLDIAASEEVKPKPEAVKEEQRTAFCWPDPCGCKGDSITAEEFRARGAQKEMRPLLVIYNDADEKRQCPQCGQLCPKDLVSGRFFCRTHGSFKLKEDTNGEG